MFNVMDDIEEFNVNSEIIEGLYYIETDNYFPLRGNGWYYHSLTSYCLEKGIISRSDIKYVVYASSTSKHDYYNGFIEYCNKIYYHTRKSKNIKIKKKKNIKMITEKPLTMNFYVLWKKKIL
jgi:hypothetical protein